MEREESSTGRYKSNEVINFEFEKLTLRRLDAGLQFGIGGSWKVGTGSIWASLQYQRGFLNMETDISANEKLFNKGVGWQLGYAYPLSAAPSAL